MTYCSENNSIEVEHDVKLDTNEITISEGYVALPIKRQKHIKMQTKYRKKKSKAHRIAGTGTSQLGD